MPTVIDYSAWRPTMQQLNAMGVEGVTRYLTYPDTAFNKAKQILKPEYDQLISARFTVLLNWEHSGSSWTLGYTVGRQHGAEARRQARALGYQDHCLIAQSVDTDPRPDMYGTALEYQRGFNDGGGCGPQGMYATDGLLRVAHDRGLIRMGWQAMARGWYNNSQDCPVANLIQRLGFGTHDTNDVRTPHWGAVNECVFGYRCQSQ